MVNASNISTLCLVSLLASCSAEPPPAPSPAPEPVARDDSALRAELDGYAIEIEKLSNGNIAPRKSAFQSSNTPGMEAYILEFSTANPALKTKDDGDTNPDSYVENRMVTSVWETRFCTDDLKALMRARGVYLVSGKLFDEKGELQTLTACMR